MNCFKLASYNWTRFPSKKQKHVIHLQILAIFYDSPSILDTLNNIDKKGDF